MTFGCENREGGSHLTRTRAAKREGEAENEGANQLPHIAQLLSAVLAFSLL